MYRVVSAIGVNVGVSVNYSLINQFSNIMRVYSSILTMPSVSQVTDNQNLGKDNNNNAKLRIIRY